MSNTFVIARGIMGTIIMPIAFLSGLWQGVGTDPEEKAIEGTASTLYQIFEFYIIADVLSIYRTVALLSFVGAMIIVIILAHWPGFLAFWAAFFGGYILLTLPELGVLLLIISWGMVLIGVAMQASGSRGYSNRRVVRY